MTDAERDEALLALGRYQHSEFSRLISVMIGMAAEFDPETLRSALGKVFDLSAVEDAAKRMVLILTDAQQTAECARILLGNVSQDIEAIDRQLDRINWDMDKLERRMKALQANQQKFRDAFIRWNDSRIEKPKPPANGPPQLQARKVP